MPNGSAPWPSNGSPNSRGRGDFTSTVLIEGMQPDESLTLRAADRAQRADRAATRARTICARASSPRISCRPGTARTGCIATPRRCSRAPSIRCRGEPLARRDAALPPREVVGRARSTARTPSRFSTTLIARADADDAIASRCLLARSSVAASNADAPGALEFALEAQRRYDLTGVESVFDRADILTAIGGAYGIMRRIRAAHERYRETLRLFEAAGRGNSRAAANLHDDWATIWMNAGNPRRALEEIDLGWEIMRELAPDAQDSDKRLARRARILAQLGDFEAALVRIPEGGRARGTARQPGQSRDDPHRRGRRPDADRTSRTSRSSISMPRRWRCGRPGCRRPLSSACVTR